MVMSFDKETKSVKLSLRQSEILEKLNNVVDNLSEDSGNKLALLPGLPQTSHSPLLVSQFRASTPNMVATCSNRRLEPPIPAPFMT